MGSDDEIFLFYSMSTLSQSSQLENCETSRVNVSQSLTPQSPWLAFGSLAASFSADRHHPTGLRLIGYLRQQGHQASWLPSSRPKPKWKQTACAPCPSKSLPLVSWHHHPQSTTDSGASKFSLYAFCPPNRQQECKNPRVSTLSVLLSP